MSVVRGKGDGSVYDVSWGDSVVRGKGDGSLYDVSWGESVVRGKGDGRLSALRELIDLEQSKAVQQT